MTANPRQGSSPTGNSTKSMKKVKYSRPTSPPAASTQAQAQDRVGRQVASDERHRRRCRARDLGRNRPARRVIAFVGMEALGLAVLRECIGQGERKIGRES